MIAFAPGPMGESQYRKSSTLFLQYDCAGVSAQQHLFIFIIHHSLKPGSSGRRAIIMFILPREEGQGLAEYAFILVFVAIAIVVIVAIFGEGLALLYDSIITDLNAVMDRKSVVEGGGGELGGARRML